MADITLDYVNSYRDPRNGKMRHQFRRKGCRKIMLKGRPGSADFMDHYAELLAQSENAAAHAGASKIKPGSIDALIVKYLKSDTFIKGLAKATQAARRPILDNFRQCSHVVGRAHDYRFEKNAVGYWDSILPQQNCRSCSVLNTPDRILYFASSSGRRRV